MSTMFKTLALAVLSLAPGALAQYPGPGPVTGDIGAHDPTVVIRPNGGYLLGVTAPGIGLKTSADRTQWDNAGVAFPDGAPWTQEYTGADAFANLWAPDLSYQNGQYYMYYSASSFGTSRSGIFLATSATGNQGDWQNQGLVIESFSGGEYNAIDPNLIVDEAGNWKLSFGSFWGGLYLIDIDPSTGLRSGDSIINLARRQEAGGAIEAPVITHHGSYYYLWASFDICCQGADSTYRVMVGRSADVEGPYVDAAGVDMTNGGGLEVLAGNPGVINGPGHQAVLEDSDGTALFYHWYDPSGFAQLGINLMRWDENGWPVVY
ncbi:hypothetical protein MBLNU230_g0647t1 [Neophaeotheca triangularis]